MSAAIKTSDQWYIDYLSRLNEAQLAECIDVTFTDGLPGHMSREEMLMLVTVHANASGGKLVDSNPVGDAKQIKHFSEETDLS